MEPQCRTSAALSAFCEDWAHLCASPQVGSITNAQVTSERAPGWPTASTLGSANCTSLSSSLELSGNGLPFSKGFHSA